MTNKIWGKLKRAFSEDKKSEEIDERKEMNENLKRVGLFTGLGLGLSYLAQKI